jgi:hypothetical protein
MHEDAAGGVQLNCAPQNFAWIDWRVIDRALVHDLVRDQVLALRRNWSALFDHP